MTLDDGWKFTAESTELSCHSCNGLFKGLFISSRGRLCPKCYDRLELRQETPEETRRAPRVIMGDFEPHFQEEIDELDDDDYDEDYDEEYEDAHMEGE